MIEKDPLPTEAQKQALCEIIADAFIQIRLIANGKGYEEIASLADAFHNIPKEMTGGAFAKTSSFNC